jgi:CheY-like chemotaxis protein
MMPMVLFVDDEPALLRTFRRIFRREKFTVLLAESPLEALAIFDRHTIDAIVSDQHMPVMCGMELLATVARRFPHTGRIIMSGDAGEFEPDGLHGVVLKPFRPETIKSVIAIVLERLTFRG